MVTYLDTHFLYGDGCIQLNLILSVLYTGGANQKSSILAFEEATGHEQ